ncbi:hypothetical protein HK097_002174 [Rhizophlyctis rosea]|uniref:Uncharacterized protein n=1 Tax=Rhizophlyctis rosea TaxID=64517 RepID=A0AAD5SIX7_9FUNG|nr:hypothetical protein HK097_002174 [Rhizophlyctis rosea]
MKITDDTLAVSDSEEGVDVVFGQDDDGYPTNSSNAQQETEDTILPLYLPYKFDEPPTSFDK